jgi:hypothetical protein
MSLLPYALRPRVILRGQIVKRGVLGGSPLLRPIALIMIGQGEYLRRGAIRHGLVLGDPLWRAIGLGLLAQGALKSAFGKSPERLAAERIGVGRTVTVATFEPVLGLGRRSRRTALRQLEAEARASLDAARHPS